MTAESLNGGKSDNPDFVSYRIQGFARTLDLHSASGYLLSDRSYWDFSGDVIAIVGKNGSGKSTILREMALSLFPELKMDKNRPRTISGPIWAGGFVVKRDGFPVDSNLYPEDLVIEHENLSEELAPQQKWERANLVRKKIFNIYDLLSVPFVQGIESTDFIPTGTPGFDFYARVQDEFSHPYRQRSLSESLENKLSEEFFRSGLIWLLPHAFPESRTDLSGEAEKIGLLPIRCAFLNEDTPDLKNHLADIRSRYLEVVGKFKDETGISPEHVNSWEIADALVQESVSIHLREDFNRIGVLDSPLFNPFNLGGDFLWNLETRYEELLGGSQPLVFDWPTFSGGGWREYICAAIDPWLLNEQSNNVLVGIFSTAKGGEFLAEFIESLGHLGNVKNSFDSISMEARQLLKDWEILPAWKTDFWEDEGFHSAEILDFGNRGITAYGWVNDVSSRWASRALQIATMKNGGHSELPKLLIWDEPELGLYPLAVRRLTEQIIPELVEDGFKIIFATHSLHLASRADQIYEAIRENAYFPDLRVVSQFDKSKLLELGFSMSDALLAQRGFVIVEGVHDQIILNTLFEKKFYNSGKRILKVNGKENILTLPETELLLAFDQPINLVLDGGERSGLSLTFLQQLNVLLKTACANNFKDIELLAERILPRSPSDEGATIKRFLVQLLNTAKVRNDFESLQKISIFMLSKDDILDYLRPSELWPGKMLDDDWARIKDQFIRYQKIRKSNQPNYKTFKTFCKIHLGLPISENSIKRAVQKSLDRTVHPDFESLEQFLFGGESWI